MRSLLKNPCFHCLKAWVSLICKDPLNGFSALRGTLFRAIGYEIVGRQKLYCNDAASISKRFWMCEGQLLQRGRVCGVRVSCPVTGQKRFCLS